MKAETWKHVSAFPFLSGVLVHQDLPKIGELSHRKPKAPVVVFYRRELYGAAALLFLSGRFSATGHAVRKTG